MSDEVLEPAALTVGAAARRLGIAAPTLRSWERRYGLGPSSRSAGGHRRYTAGDLARLQAVLRLVNRGVPTAAAVEAVQDRPPVAVQSGTTPSVGRAVVPPRIGRGPGRPVPTHQPEDLFELANAMEGERLTQAIARNLDRSGVVQAWTDRLAPLLVEVGDQWERTGACVEVEHLASDSVAGAIRYHTRRSVDRFPPDPAERPVILACLEGEDHALPLLAVAASLAERSVGVRTLGAATPIGSLEASIGRVRPAAVFVWSSAPATADLPALRRMARTRPPYVLVVGGPGWPLEPERVASLERAVTALVRAVRPEGSA